MKITKTQLKQLITEARTGVIGGIGFGPPPVQEAQWEDNPDPYGGAEGDLDMGHIHDSDDLYQFLSNQMAELMDEAFDLRSSLGLKPKEIRDVFASASQRILETYFPENRR
jgi:hypothetical protein